MNILNLKGKSVEEIKETLDKYLFVARKARVKEYSSQGGYGSTYGKVCAIPMIELEGTPYKLSVQASSSHYCSPREDLQHVYEMMPSAPISDVISFNNFCKVVSKEHGFKDYEIQNYLLLKQGGINVN